MRWCPTRATGARRASSATAWSSTTPCSAARSCRTPATLPARWGLLEVSSPNVVVSALKPGREGTTILRVYEAAGRPASGVKIAFNAKVAEARTANLLEDPESELKVEITPSRSTCVRIRSARSG